MKDKKKIIIIIIIIVLTSIVFFTREKKYASWEKYLKTYKDKTLKIEEKIKDKYYSYELVLKDKVLYVVADDIIDDKKQVEISKNKMGYKIRDNIIQIYNIKYENIVYTYLIDNEGNTYYLNNIKDSTAKIFELTKLGDYKYVVDIKVKKDKITARTIKNKKIEMQTKLDSYIKYNRI